MKNVLTSWFFCVCATISSAQTGSYFLSHHSPSKENFDNVCFDIVQDKDGMMYFAMKAGVLEFDGRDWELIPGAGAVYGLNRNESGEIFWVGAKGFGRLGFNEEGQKEIQFLSDSTVSNVFQTLAIGQQVYFLSGNKIFLYRGGKSKVEEVVSRNIQGMFTGMFELFGIVYVQTERNTTFKIEGNTLVYVKLNFSGNVLFQSRLSDRYVLGTSDNRLYSCTRDLVFRHVPIEDQPYADANVVISVTWINADLLALGTLRGGVMLVNPSTGRRDQIIDYSTGLPDNEVFSLMADADQNIWVAHEYGFTQISPTLPFRSFSYYSGLEGNMLCVYSHRGHVYVGTSLGLFKLDKDEIYDEVVTWIEPAGQGNVADDGSNTTDGLPAEAVDTKDSRSSKRRGFFNFLRRKRDKPETDSAQVADAAPLVERQEASKEDDNGGPQKRIDKVLRSSQHTFKKVAGIDAKITHLTEMNGKLIAAGLEGVFEIRSLRAEALLHSPIRYVHSSEKLNSLIVSTYNDEIWSLQNGGAEWQALSLVNGLGDQIDYIFEGSDHEWWLCGLDRIYQLQLNTEGIERLQTISLSNPNFEKTVGLYLNDQVYFVNTDGFYHFNRAEKRLARLDSLPKAYQYFAVNGQILYRDQHRWNLFGKMDPNSNLQLLNLFQNLRFIATDENRRNLWLISGSNELLRFNGENIPAISSRFPIFLKSIQNNTVKIADFRHIEIDQNSSSVTFEFVQPDFINPRGIEFRYFLDGMHQEWSEWSSGNNKINFPYLPPGEYHLRVEARNIFGKVSELRPIPFEVIPPYWKRPWFYALEFLLFASLVILSFRLSTRYRIISRFLSLITIILLIEFIQTVIGSSIISDDSPVVEFLIQFVVAILILPVEGFLRNLMLRSLDSSSGFYNFITPAGVQDRRGKKSRKRRKAKELL